MVLSRLMLLGVLTFVGVAPARAGEKGASQMPTDAVCGVVEHAALAQTFTYSVWAHSLLIGDYGHHQVGFAGATEQEALNKLAVYQLAWGQRLQKMGKHYNSIESRRVSNQMRGEADRLGSTVGTAWEVYASGICMCTDGSCKTVQCKAEVGSAAEVEVAKSRLRFELKVQAQSLNGTLNESSVSFSVRLK